MAHNLTTQSPITRHLIFLFHTQGKFGTNDGSFNFLPEFYSVFTEKSAALYRLKLELCSVRKK
jgi:hypothetical protein